MLLDFIEKMWSFWVVPGCEVCIEKISYCTCIVKLIPWSMTVAPIFYPVHITFLFNFLYRVFKTLFPEMWYVLNSSLYNYNFKSWSGVTKHTYNCSMPTVVIILQLLVRIFPHVYILAVILWHHMFTEQLWTCGNNATALQRTYFVKSLCSVFCWYVIASNPDTQKKTM